jgi:acetyl-CoA acetyltransferase family protein
LTRCDKRRKTARLSTRPAGVGRPTQETDMAQAVILDAVRTPIGKRNGALSGIRADELAALPLAALRQRAVVPDGSIDDVVMGCVTQIGEQGFNIARVAALIAGYPVTVAGTSVNRQCGSSLQALNFVSQAIISEQQDVAIAAGVESMSRIAMGSDAAEISEKLTERFDLIPQGLSAELIAQKWGFSRTQLDEFAARSHERALAAQAAGYFDREIVAVETTTPDGQPIVVTRDEGPREGSTVEKLAKLKPAFKGDGVITAASSSQISDGAAAIVLASADRARALGARPRARIVATAIAGVDPTIMLTGPIPATHKALAKAGLSIGDIDLFEVNEAFAPVVLAWAAETGGDLDRTNVNGGACALGHPLGCSGVRLITTLLHELERRDLRYGLATLCIGFGQGVATIIDRKVD